MNKIRKVGRSTGLTPKAAGAVVASAVKRANIIQMYRSRGFPRPSGGVLKLGNLKNKLVFAERYCTWVENSIQGYVTFDAAAGNYTNVNVSSLVTPFNTTYTLTATGSTYSWSGLLQQGNSTNNNPMGYTQLASLYTKYKVLRYVVEMTLHPQVSTDSALLIGFPTGTEEIPSASAANVNTLVFSGQSQNRQRWVSNASDITKNKVTIRGTIAENLGKREAQWKDLQSTDMASMTTGDNAAYVAFFAQIAGGSNGTAATAVQIKLKQYVELTDINAQIN